MSHEELKIPVLSTIILAPHENETALLYKPLALTSYLLAASSL